MKIRTLFALAALLFPFAVSSVSNAGPYSEYGRPVRLEFEGRVRIHRATTPERPSEVQKEIELQLKYFMGQYVHSQYHAVYQPNVTPIRFLYHRVNPNDLDVYYTISVPAVVERQVIPKMTFTLPLNPKDAFEIARAGGEKNLCTHGKGGEKVGFDSFWYHWNPTVSGCPLRLGTDYIEIKPRVYEFDELPPMEAPVAKLVKPDGSIEISMFFGPHEDKIDRQAEWTYFNPYTKEGDKNGGDSFVKVSHYLYKLGFTEGAPWTKEDFQKNIGTSPGESHFYVREYRNNAGQAPILVRLFFGQTVRKFNAYAFHLMLSKAMQTSSYIGYNGHSGLGYNLDLPSLERQTKLKFQFNPDFHQWVYLDGCVTDHYYKMTFQSRKPKGLTLWTTLAESRFEYGAYATEILIQSIWDWNTSNKTSWLSDLAQDRTGMTGRVPVAADPGDPN